METQKTPLTIFIKSFWLSVVPRGITQTIIKNKTIGQLRSENSFLKVEFHGLYFLKFVNNSMLHFFASICLNS